jgi:hypothetical protein
MPDPGPAGDGSRGKLGLQIPPGSLPKDPKAFLCIGIFFLFIPEFGVLRRSLPLFTCFLLVNLNNKVID